MRGLIIKDLINLKRQSMIMAVLVVFYIVLALTMENNSMLGGVLAVMSAILPITAMSYDERAHWDKYALSMPVSRNDVVISKYILGLLLSAASFIITLVFNMITHGDTPLDNLLTSLALSVIALLFLSLLLPILFKFGVEKGRLLMMLLLFLPTALIVVFAKLGFQAPGEETLVRLALASPFILALVVAASILLSIRIYARKEM